MTDWQLAVCGGFAGFSLTWFLYMWLRGKGETPQQAEPKLPAFSAEIVAATIRAYTDPYAAEKRRVREATGLSVFLTWPDLADWCEQAAGWRNALEAIETEMRGAHDRAHVMPISYRNAPQQELREEALE